MLVNIVLRFRSDTGVLLRQDHLKKKLRQMLLKELYELLSVTNVCMSREQWFEGRDRGRKQMPHTRPPHTFRHWPFMEACSGPTSSLPSIATLN